MNRTTTKLNFLGIDERNGAIETDPPRRSTIGSTRLVPTTKQVRIRSLAMPENNNLEKHLQEPTVYCNIFFMYSKYDRQTNGLYILSPLFVVDDPPYRSFCSLTNRY